MPELTRDEYAVALRKHGERLEYQLGTARALVAEMQRKLRKHEHGVVVYGDADYLRDLQKLQAVLEARVSVRRRPVVEVQP